MKTIAYTTMDKSGWGPGPWQSEPDKIQFEDPDTGLPCLIVRSGLGALCGYVGVPESHPFFGKDWLNIADIRVHGGLTFSNSCMTDERFDSAICHIIDEGETDKVWWLGFDCAHCFDLVPSMNLHVPELADSLGGIYRNIAYVKSEIASLAKQLESVC